MNADTRSTPGVEEWVPIAQWLIEEGTRTTGSASIDVFERANCNESIRALFQLMHACTTLYHGLPWKLPADCLRATYTQRPGVHGIVHWVDTFQAHVLGPIHADTSITDQRVLTRWLETRFLVHSWLGATWHSTCRFFQSPIISESMCARLSEVAHVYFPSLTDMRAWITPQIIVPGDANGVEQPSEEESSLGSTASTSPPFENTVAIDTAHNVWNPAHFSATLCIEEQQDLEQLDAVCSAMQPMRGDHVDIIISGRVGCLELSNIRHLRVAVSSCDAVANLILHEVDHLSWSTRGDEDGHFDNGEHSRPPNPTQQQQQQQNAFRARLQDVRSVRLAQCWSLHDITALTGVPYVQLVDLPSVTDVSALAQAQQVVLHNIGLADVSVLAQVPCVQVISTASPNRRDTQGSIPVQCAAITKVNVAGPHDLVLSGGCLNGAELCSFPSVRLLDCKGNVSLVQHVHRLECRHGAVLLEQLKDVQHAVLMGHGQPLQVRGTERVHRCRVYHHTIPDFAVFSGVRHLQLVHCTFDDLGMHHIKRESMATCHACGAICDGH
ncbi:hypothetical protein PTSG_10341 [Salpingoeca rosetta]|uniref:Uncharacterized protein n=1 Tax=Salpingoeca rosetta (strain ATCC 50818 / BSB-021) TaxID=946362 RepID=F2UR10_SALR5|nr:uncharacterized protein PTSG_10341 [Salpingoeca rosetta]EGD80065.1 hypothetical protein PTSG_10341 [Salpingoeca rosetta]|eukprot:XP_004988390.1 hypothetical protein PTSG_10341 [Salpingoeca rosetta]